MGVCIVWKQSGLLSLVFVKILFEQSHSDALWFSRKNIYISELFSDII